MRLCVWNNNSNLYLQTTIYVHDYVVGILNKIKSRSIWIHSHTNVFRLLQNVSCCYNNIPIQRQHIIYRQREWEREQNRNKTFRKCFTRFVPRQAFCQFAVISRARKRDSWQRRSNAGGIMPKYEYKKKKKENRCRLKLYERDKDQAIHMPFIRAHRNILLDILRSCRVYIIVGEPILFAEFIFCNSVRITFDARSCSARRSSGGSSRICKI